MLLISICNYYICQVAGTGNNHKMCVAVRTFNFNTKKNSA